MLQRRRAPVACCLAIYALGLSAGASLRAGRSLARRTLSCSAAGEAAALAYANRSMVHFEQAAYDACERDCARALALAPVARADGDTRWRDKITARAESARCQGATPQTDDAVPDELFGHEAALVAGLHAVRLGKWQSCTMQAARTPSRCATRRNRADTSKRRSTSLRVNTVAPADAPPNAADCRLPAAAREAARRRAHRRVPHRVRVLRQVRSRFV